MSSNKDNPLFPSGRGFRIVFNGEVLTSRMDHCDRDICDLNVLMDLVAPFATWDRNCSSLMQNHPQEAASDDMVLVPVVCTPLLESHTQWGWLIGIMMLLLSACLGSFIMLVFLTRTNVGRTLVLGRQIGFEEIPQSNEPRQQQQTHRMFQSPNNHRTSEPNGISMVRRPSSESYQHHP
jgi:hypothetical protein